MASALLFHGPGARIAALDQAYLMGRLLEPPFGDEGLKVDEARRVVHLLSSIPIGSEKGVVVVGPMERANYKAGDVLLKSLEEFDGRYLQPVLWAEDLGGVSETIRSRCLARWSPPTEDIPDDDELVAAGFDLVQATLDNEGWRIPTLVRGYLTTHKGGEHDLLRASADVLYPQLGETRQRTLWAQLRKAAQHRNPTPIEIMVAFLLPVESP